MSHMQHDIPVSVNGNLRVLHQRTSTLKDQVCRWLSATAAIWIESQGSALQSQEPLQL